MDEWDFPERDEESGWWRLRCVRESEMTDRFRIPDIAPIATALGLTVDQWRRATAGGRTPDALSRAWQSFIGDGLWEGLDRLRAIGVDPEPAGQWVPGGDWGYWIPPATERTTDA